MSKLKKIPDFKTEDEEREFWATHNMFDYLDPKKFKRVPPPMTPKTHDAVFLRLPKKISKEVEKLSRKQHKTVEEVVRQLVTTGLGLL
jgi:hypothetical protein